MKLIAPLLVLAIASPVFSAPLPPTTILEAPCTHYGSCRPFRILISSWLSSKPRLKMSQLQAQAQAQAQAQPLELEFPPHQLVDDAGNKAAPHLRGPTVKHQSPIAGQPKRIYIPGMTPTHHIPAAATSSLPSLREEDALRAGHGSPSTPDELYGHPYGHHAGEKCHTHHRSRTTTTTIRYGISYVHRESMDVLVVGTVVLFMLAVVLVELAEKLARLRHSVKLEDGEKGRIQREELYDDEDLPRYTKKPCSDELAVSCTCACGRSVVGEKR